MEILRNQITALIGPSGCGKSTLLRCFNRMNDLILGFRMEGSIRFDGVEITTADTDPVSLRRRIGMVFQKPNPFPKSIYQNVAWGRLDQRVSGETWTSLSSSSSCRVPSWDEVATSLICSGLDLSGGSQQHAKALLIAYLAVEPGGDPMDEPCSGVRTRSPTARSKTRWTISRIECCRS